MPVDNLPSLNPPAFGDVCDPRRPILSYAWHAAGPHRAAAHNHVRAHIIHPEAGAYWVITPEGTWLVPAGQAIWIPPRVHHEVYSHCAVSARMLFVDPAYADPLPPRCGTVTVSPLLAELIRRTVGYGNDYAPAGPAARLALVMLDELAAMELAPLLLPISKEPRVARVMQWLIEDPAARDGLERGTTVTEVAADLGYSTASSFVYMFRSNLGVAPGCYRARDGGS